MSYSVCKKLNEEPQICKTRIIKLDRSNVKAMGELKDVLIRLASNSKVHQTIDIIVLNIPEAYGVILSRYWSAKLNGYFTTDWSHLWLSYKGQPNKIKVERERYMKHIVTDLNDVNELIMFSNFILCNLCFDTFFGELDAELSPFANSDTQYELLHCAHIANPNCTLVDISSTNFCTEVTHYNLWTLYFYGPENKDGEGVGFLLIDPHGNQTKLACLLEFRCTNNVVEYEALVQGLRKAIDLNAKCLEVFGDSQIVIREVRDFIHCTSHHLKNYQREVWNLMNKFEAFNIKSIPHIENCDVDMLENVASNLILSDDFTHDIFFVELIYRPSIPSNITNWRIFDDDQQIIDYLHLEYTFRGLVIDDEQHESLL
jgi:ribonuclease HI